MPSEPSNLRTNVQATLLRPIADASTYTGWRMGLPSDGGRRAGRDRSGNRRQRPHRRVCYARPLRRRRRKSCMRSEPVPGLTRHRGVSGGRTIRETGRSVAVTVAVVLVRWTQTSGGTTSLLRSRILLVAGISVFSPAGPAVAESTEATTPEDTVADNERRRDAGYGRRHKRRSGRNRIVPAADPSPGGNDGRTAGILRIPSCGL